MKAPHGYWQDPSNHRSVIHKIAKDLQISSPQDWFHVTCAHLRQYSGSILLTRYKSLSKVLTALVPEYKQACRDFVMQMVHDMNLSSAADLVKQIEYTRYMKKCGPQVMSQHDDSVHKCMPDSFFPSQMVSKCQWHFETIWLGKNESGN